MLRPTIKGKNMKGYLSAIAFLLFSTGVAATQLTTKSIEYHYPNSTEIQYRLPWFTSPDNPAVAKRINDYLFSSLLNHLPGKDPQATLNQLVKAGLDGTENLDYTVEYRKGDILTINVFAEGCGAYCESYDSPMSFDLTSGSKIAISDVVIADALPQLNDQIRQDIRTRIATFVAQQKALPVAEQRIDEDQVIDYGEFYSTCYVSTIDGIDYTDRFSIKDNKLVFLNGRCSNHASRALDDLGDFTTSIAVSKLKDTLTPYGRRLLLVEGQQPVSPEPELSGKLLYGTLGKNTRIILNVTCGSEYIRGAYFYEKFGAPIALSGKCTATDKRHYELTTAEQDVRKETFTLDLIDGHYQGVWESNGKTLPVRFE